MPVRPRIRNWMQLFWVVAGVAVGAHAVDSALAAVPFGVTVRVPVDVDAARVVDVVRQNVPVTAALAGGIRYQACRRSATIRPSPALARSRVSVRFWSALALPPVLSEMDATA